MSLQYIPGWRELAREVKEEAGWKCVRCRAEHSPGTWRVLTVHHFDRDTLNNQWWNLLPLCQRCHLRIQGRVNPHIAYFLEHAEWIKPYVAGFYAWKYEGKALTREEVMDRLDELLGYEQKVNYKEPGRIAGAAWPLDFAHNLHNAVKFRRQCAQKAGNRDVDTALSEVQECLSLALEGFRLPEFKGEPHPHEILEEPPGADATTVDPPGDELPASEEGPPVQSRAVASGAGGDSGGGAEVKETRRGDSASGSDSKTASPPLEKVLPPSAKPRGKAGGAGLAVSDDDDGWEE